MLPDPLHPAVVHFPVVLAVLMPLVLLVTVVAIRRNGRTRLWIIPVTLAAMLAASSWVATETGEQEEERVERVVAEQAIETHAEQAERFLAISGAFAVLAAAGLLGGAAGAAARGLALAGSVALVVMVAQVAHAGGELVYQHGAAAAYTSGASALPPSAGGSDHD
jgi:uncharacterized membrane protein